MIFEQIVQKKPSSKKDGALSSLNSKLIDISTVCTLVFSPFLANIPILHPMKTPENQRFSGVFTGYKMGTLARKKQPAKLLYKKGVLKSFAKFTEKHLCQSLFIKLY